VAEFEVIKTNGTNVLVRPTSGLDVALASDGEGFMRRGDGQPEQKDGDGDDQAEQHVAFIGRRGSIGLRVYRSGCGINAALALRRTAGLEGDKHQLLSSGRVSVLFVWRSCT